MDDDKIFRFEKIISVLSTFLSEETSGNTEVN